jgi:hypothetical protein
MSGFFMPTGGPGALGLYFASHGPWKVMNRTGATMAKGNLVAFDLENSEASTIWTPGNALHPAAQVVAVAAGMLTGAVMTVFALVTDVLADGGVDNSEIEVAVSGLLDALIIDNGTPAARAPGAHLVGTTAENLDIDPAATGLILGLNASNGTTFTAATLAPCQFFGWKGLLATAA